MADLMCNHIGFGEFASLAAAAAETLTHITEERGIEVDASVGRTIERPHCRLRETAAALLRARKQTQTRHAVLLAAVPEDFGPRVLGIAENSGNEITHLVLWPAGPARGRLIGLLVVPAAVDEFGATNQHARIDTERPADQAEHDDGSNAEPAATDR